MCRFVIHAVVDIDIGRKEMEDFCTTKIFCVRSSRKILVIWNNEVNKVEINIKMGFDRSCW